MTVETVGAGLVASARLFAPGIGPGYYSVRAGVSLSGRQAASCGSRATARGRFSTELFDRFQRAAEKALVSGAGRPAVYVQGGVLGPRKVKAVTEELCGHTFSASTVSRINKSLGWTAPALCPTAGSTRRIPMGLIRRCAVREGRAMCSSTLGDPVAGGLRSAIGINAARAGAKSWAGSSSNGCVECALELDDLRHQPSR